MGRWRTRLVYLVLVPALAMAACVVGYYSYLSASQFDALGGESIAQFYSFEFGSAKFGSYGQLRAVQKVARTYNLFACGLNLRNAQLRAVSTGYHKAVFYDFCHGGWR